MRAAAILALTTLAACGMPYEEGMLRRGELNCELAEACGTIAFFGGNVEACKEDAAGQGYDEADCPGYDAKAMRECVEAWEGAVADGACDGETYAALGEACAVCE